MEAQSPVAQIFESATRLEGSDFETLFNQLNRVRAERVGPSLPPLEADLLKKINAGFPSKKWLRLTQLDAKMEASDLSPVEAEESLRLAEELEAYTVRRFGWLKKLAALRGISIEQLMLDLDIAPRAYA